MNDGMGDSFLYYSMKTSKTDKYCVQGYFTIKGFLIKHGRTIFFAVCSLLIFSVFIVGLFRHEHQSTTKQFKYKEISLKTTEAKIRYLSKYIVGLVLKDVDKISVPLMGGAEYCVGIRNFINETGLIKMSQVEAYARGYDPVTGGFLVYFYTHEGVIQPVFFDQEITKLIGMMEYANYYDKHPEGFNFSFVGPLNYHNGEFTFTPTYIPPNYRIVIVTDYITSHYFEEMVEHFYEKQLLLHIIYIIPMDCLRDTALETDRSPKRETCFLLQRWARLSNKTGRGVASKITLQAMIFLDYISLYNSSHELVEAFYNVWTPTPPWWKIRVMVYSSHALRLAKVTDNYIQTLGIKEYFKINCLEIY